MPPMPAAQSTRPNCPIKRRRTLRGLRNERTPPENPADLSSPDNRVWRPFSSRRRRALISSRRLEACAVPASSSPRREDEAHGTTRRDSSWRSGEEEESKREGRVDASDACDVTGIMEALVQGEAASFLAESRSARGVRDFNANGLAEDSYATRGIIRSSLDECSLGGTCSPSWLSLNWPSDPAGCEEERPERFQRVANVVGSICGHLLQKREIRRRPSVKAR